MTIELLWLPGCPHVAAARALVGRCLERLRIQATLAERMGDYPSPTVLVNGQDVMGGPASPAEACRLDVPTADRLMAALRAARGGGRP